MLASFVAVCKDSAFRAVTFLSSDQLGGVLSIVSCLECCTAGNTSRCVVNLYLIGFAEVYSIFGAV